MTTRPPGKSPGGIFCLLCGQRCKNVATYLRDEGVTCLSSMFLSTSACWTPESSQGFISYPLAMFLPLPASPAAGAWGAGPGRRGGLCSDSIHASVLDPLDVPDTTLAPQVGSSSSYLPPSLEHCSLSHRREPTREVTPL